MTTKRSRIHVPKREKRFNYAHIETALCLWENFIEIELLEGDKVPLTKVFCDLRSNVGSYELRRIMHELAIPAGKIWDKTLTEDERYEWTFDWEFCPSFLLHAVDWESFADNKVDRDRPDVFADGWLRMKAHEAIRSQFGSHQ